MKAWLIRWLQWFADVALVNHEHRLRSDMARLERQVAALTERCANAEASILGAVRVHGQSITLGAEPVVTREPRKFTYEARQ